VRQFVVGTGGVTIRSFATVQPHSEVRIPDKGVLRLELRDASYGWSFVDDQTLTVDDSGSASCH
jgi:hypothetical protein